MRPVDRQRAESALSRLDRCPGDEVQRDLEKSARGAVVTQPPGEVRECLERAEQFVGKEERLAGRAACAEFLRALIEPLDVRTGPIVEERGKVRDSLEPKPGA